MALEIGKLYDGKVTKITAFGAFVALEEGASGLVHISEISRGFVKNVADFLEEGQSVRVKLIGTDEKGRHNLSIRQALDDEAAAVRKAPPIEYTAKPQSSDSFEDMMTRFKAASNEKMSDLKQSYAAKRGAPGRPRRRCDD